MGDIACGLWLDLGQAAGDEKAMKLLQSVTVQAKPEVIRETVARRRDRDNLVLILAYSTRSRKMNETNNCLLVCVALLRKIV
jgi:hypothetical protein